jgi:hypothetical protein
MIDSDKIKVGQRVWFKNGDKIESGCIAGWGQHEFGPIAFNIRKDPDQNGFAPTLEGWWACFLYETKLDCLRYVLNETKNLADGLASDALRSKNRCNELAAQIKEEEKERAANAVGKVHPVRWVNSRFGELVLVQLPRCIEAGVKDRKEESPVVVRTDHVLLRYEYGCTPNGDREPTHNGLVIIYPADKLGRIVSIKDMPYKGVHVDRHPRNYGVTVDDIRAAVKSLGFELEG